LIADGPSSPVHPREPKGAPPPGLRGAEGATRVWINDYHPYLPQAEWGGFGRSGVGRELGPSGLEEYTEKKHLYHNTSPAPARWFSG